MINGHDIPALSYFENKNPFSGSEGNNFRFRIEAIDGKLNAFVWYEDLCFEMCEVAAEEKFEMTKDGLEKAVDWIFEQKK